MADVLIKGMKMPKSCEWCPIREDTFCDIISKDIDRFYEGAVRRDKDCPLVEVPEHGRLIDADELYDLIDGGFDLDFDELPETKRELLRMIQDAATVIEASEDGEEDA